VEIGAERLPFHKRRFAPKNPLAGFFERARTRLQDFLDASKEAKASQERPAREDPTIRTAQEDPKSSSLQDLFRTYEARKAYGTPIQEPPSAR